jgi:hypothetical protein
MRGCVFPADMIGSAQRWPPADLLGSGELCLWQVRLDSTGARGRWCICRYSPSVMRFFLVADGCCTDVLARWALAR